jgi:hypothetical protein
MRLVADEARPARTSAGEAAAWRSDADKFDVADALAISALTDSVLARTDMDGSIAPALLAADLVAGSERPALLDPPNRGVASLAIAADGVDASSAADSDIVPAGAAAPTLTAPLVEPTKGGLGRSGRRAVESGGG